MKSRKRSTRKTRSDRIPPENSYTVDPETGCWIWNRYRSAAGYGKCTLDDGAQGYAHRYFFAKYVSPLKPDEWVLHRCDTPSCVNPAHLFSGSAAENTADMLRKGRQSPPRGERSGAAKLTEADVSSMRTRYASGETQTSLGKEFGVSQSAVSRVVNRKRWTHI